MKLTTHDMNGSMFTTYKVTDGIEKPFVILT